MLRSLVASFRLSAAPLARARGAPRFGPAAAPSRALSSSATKEDAGRSAAGEPDETERTARSTEKAEEVPFDEHKFDQMYKRFDELFKSGKFADAFLQAAKATTAGDAHAVLTGALGIEFNKTEKLLLMAMAANHFPTQATQVAKHLDPYAVRKGCLICQKQPRVDHMNVELLDRFIDETGRILPKRFTQLCSKHQRRVSTLIIRARNFGLMPYLYKMARAPDGKLLQPQNSFSFASLIAMIPAQNEVLQQQTFSSLGSIPLTPDAPGKSSEHGSGDGSQPNPLRNLNIDTLLEGFK